VFFSSILPNPKARYEQFCKGELAKWTERKLDVYLKVMLDRHRLTQDEYDQAMATPLVFAPITDETPEKCLERTIKAIKKARPTRAQPR
jgi:hypothetical protein